MLKGEVKLVAISGKAGSGKSLLANALMTRCGYSKFSFAAPIYAMLNVLPYLHHIHGGMDRIQKEEKISFYGKSPRELLQTLGTEWGRNLVHPDVWIRIMENSLVHEYNHNRKYVIDDLRFPNEVEWVRATGGLVVRIHRGHEVQVVKHVSEYGFPLLEDDVRISNDGSAEDLIRQVNRIDDLAFQRMVAVRSYGV